MKKTLLSLLLTILGTTPMAHTNTLTPAHKKLDYKLLQKSSLLHQLHEKSPNHPVFKECNTIFQTLRTDIETASNAHYGFIKSGATEHIKQYGSLGYSEGFATHVQALEPIIAGKIRNTLKKAFPKGRPEEITKNVDGLFELFDKNLEADNPKIAEARRTALSAGLPRGKALMKKPTITKKEK